MADYKRLKAKFEFFDKDKSGHITLDELKSVAKQLGYTECDAMKIMETRDKDKSGSISFGEFSAGVSKLPKETQSQAEARAKFLEYDKNQDGFVSVDEAHAILSKELAMTKDAVERLINKYDIDRDGKIHYEGFVKVYGRVQIKKKVMEDMFKSMDADGSGWLSADEVADVLKAKEGFTEEEVYDLVHLHDKNNDRRLDYNEFVSFWKSAM